MSLVVKNSRVYDFYQKHPHFDFEKMNVLLVDLLENFQECLAPSFNQTAASKLMQQFTEMQMDLVKNQQTQQLEHYKQLNDFRTKYTEELKHAIHYNHTEKVQPLLTQELEAFQEKIQQWQKDNPMMKTQCNELKNTLQQEIERASNATLQKDQMHEFIRSIEEKMSFIMNSSETRLQEGLREQNRKLELLSNSYSDQEKINNQVNDLLRKMDNSSSKGKVSETILGHVIHSLYPMGEIKAVGTTKETGDILMSRDGLPTVLFENKNYDRNVGQDEVQKFLRDVETQKCCGILLAQNYGIANRANFEIHIYQGQVCVYLHSVQYEPEKIKAAVDIIDHLSKYINNTQLQSEDIILDFEFLESLNREYQTFTQQKLSQIKMVKDYSQKMLLQIEELKMPQLELWLGNYFSQSLASKENQCKFCGFEAKTTSGLTSHMRACKKRTNTDSPPPIPPPPKPEKPIQIVLNK